MTAISPVTSYELRDQRDEEIPGKFVSIIREHITPCEREVLEPHHWRIPLWYFESGGKKLLSRKAVSIEIYRDDSLVVADSRSLGIFACENSRNEVINDFIEQVVHFYYHYKNLGWDEVIGEGERLKRLYEDVFEEI